MVQLQAAQKGAEVTSEATERELELEAQLVEARSIIVEQVIISCFCNHSLNARNLLLQNRFKENKIANTVLGLLSTLD